MPTETTVFAAIASPRRREILRLIWDEELRAGAIHAAMPDVVDGVAELVRGLFESVTGFWSAHPRT